MPGHSSSRSPNKSGGNGGDTMDLSVVDKSFGDYADLYGDVLRISSGATHEQIQLAYFDRRSELFTLLAKIDAKSQDDRTVKERRQAESRMDSVVLAVRILGDAETRDQYDTMRRSRLMNRRRAKSVRMEQEYNRKPVPAPVLRNRSVNEGPTTTTRAEKSKSKSHRRQPSSTSTIQEKVLASLNETMSTNTDADTYDDYTVETRQDDTTIGDTTVGTTTIGDATMDTYSIFSEEGQDDSGFLCGGSRIVRKITSEVKGAFEDTITSVDQVFNAFTLTDKDIRAVTKRIDRAKRQLEV